MCVCVCVCVCKQMLVCVGGGGQLQLITYFITIIGLTRDMTKLLVREAINVTRQQDTSKQTEQQWTRGQNITGTAVI